MSRRERKSERAFRQYWERFVKPWATWPTSELTDSDRLKNIQLLLEVAEVQLPAESSMRQELREFLTMLDERIRLKVSA